MRVVGVQDMCSIKLDVHRDVLGFLPLSFRDG